MKETRNCLIQFRCFDWEKKLIMKLAGNKVSNLRSKLVNEAKVIYSEDNKIATLNKKIRELDEKIFDFKDELQGLASEREITVKMIEEEVNK